MGRGGGGGGRGGGGGGGREGEGGGGGGGGEREERKRRQERGEEERGGGECRPLDGCGALKRKSAASAIVLIGKWNKRVDHALVQQSRQFIDRNLTNNQLSLQYVATAVGVSANHLSKVFHRGTGLTYIEYVTDRKLTEAARILVSENPLVGTVALQLGYGSPNHFIRLFKSKFGMTPKQFQKSRNRDS